MRFKGFVSVLAFSAACLSGGVLCPAAEPSDPVARELITRLKEGDDKQKVQTLREIRQMDTAPMVDVLVEQLDPHNRKQFMAAWNALACSSDPNTPRRMVESIRKIEGMPLRVAFEGLSTEGKLKPYDGYAIGRVLARRSGPEQIAPLLQWIREGEGLQCSAALRALAVLGRPEDARTLLAMHSACPQDEFGYGPRTLLLEVVAEIGQSDVVDALSRLAHQAPKEFDRLAAVSALGSVGDANAVAHLIHMLKHGKGSMVRARAASLLGTLPYRPKAGGAPGPRIIALRSILRKKPEANRDSPGGGTKYDDPTAQAALALAKLGDRESLPRIRHLARLAVDRWEEESGDGGLELGDRFVEEEGMMAMRPIPDQILALIYLDSPDAIGILRKLNRKGQFGPWCWEVCRALSRHPLPGGERFLMKQLWPTSRKSGRFGLIGKALNAYAMQAKRKGDRQRLARIESFLSKALGQTKQEEIAVRSEIIELLKEIGTSRSTGAILSVLKASEKGWLRVSLFDALGSIGDANALPTLRPMLQADEPQLLPLARAMDALGEKKLDERLIPLSRHSNWTVRSRATRALSLQATPAACKRLRELLASPASVDRNAAAWALGEAKDRESIPTLRKLMREDASHLVRAEAARALAKLADRWALPTVLKRLATVRVQNQFRAYSEAAILLDAKKASNTIVRRIGRRRGRVPYSLLSPFAEAPPASLRTVIAELRKWHYRSARRKADWLEEKLRRPGE